MIMGLIVSDFNPRTHEGCDFNTDGVMLSLNNFNPRTHEGCDASWAVF